MSDIPLSAPKVIIMSMDKGVWSQVKENSFTETLSGPIVNGFSTLIFPAVYFIHVYLCNVLYTREKNENYKMHYAK